MKKEILQLRKEMQRENIDCYLVSKDDCHGSEDVNPYFEAIEFLTGFTGSNGKVLVTQDMAGLWTDGRYFLQGEMQLQGTGVTLFKMNEKGVPTIEEYIKAEIGSKATIGFNGKTIMWETIVDFNIDNKIKDIDLISPIWKDRPNCQFGNTFFVKGDSVQSKVEYIRKFMEEKKAEYSLISKLDTVAWLLNLRGTDVPFSPLFYAYVVVSKEEVWVYSSISEKTQNELIKINDNVKFKFVDYNNIYEDATKLKGDIIVTLNGLNYTLAQKLYSAPGELVDSVEISKYKAVKTKGERLGTEYAHIKDGTAMAKFIYWLKNHEEPLDEMKVKEKLCLLRRNEEGFIDLSFAPIVGWNGNGAIIHYDVNEDTNKEITGNGFLLVDSGSHYTDGTTDITRTITIGKNSALQKKHYTYVLKSMLSLLWQPFKSGATGAELDTLARKIMWQNGLDYKHGTGHGVGHILPVHEGPNGIGTAYKTPIESGNITTIEPGLYFEDEYGIRIENETLCVESYNNQYGDFLELLPITYCPLEMEAIEICLLDKEEIEKVNKYNDIVYAKLKDRLEENEKKWLREVTKPL